MRSFLLSLMVGLCAGFLHAQVPDTLTVYYDSAWVKCGEEAAVYYRKAWQEGKLYKVRDYYLSGELQMTGQFLDSKFKKYHGPFVYYFKNGTVQYEKEWEDDWEVGHWKYFSENGTLTEEVFYGSKDQKRWKKIFYRETGEKYSEGEESREGDIGWWTFYYRDGTPSAEEYWEKGKMTDYKLYNTEGRPQNNPDYRSHMLPEYKGHKGGIAGYLWDEVEYPEACKGLGVQGTVKIRMVVDAEGNLVSAELVEPVYSLLDDEALRVTSQMLEWKPGRRHNQVVQMTMVLPIRFKLR